MSSIDPYDLQSYEELLLYEILQQLTIIAQELTYMNERRE